MNKLDSFYSMSGNENTLNENDLEMLKKLHEEKINEIGQLEEILNFYHKKKKKKTNLQINVSEVESIHQINIKNYEDKPRSVVPQTPDFKTNIFCAKENLNFSDEENEKISPKNFKGNLIFLLL